MTADAIPNRLDTMLAALPERSLVSIVVPCLNEERYIVALLDALAVQDYGPADIEVLVADGGSTDASRVLVRGYASPFRRLELVDNPNRITVSGLNAGMDAARGDCWIILGAHSHVRADFVRASVEALRRTGAACVGGPIETIGEGDVGRAIAAAMSSPFGVGNAKFRYADIEADVDTVPFGCYRRVVWDIVGRFDETVDGADEDSYNARIIEAGGRIVLVPSIRSSYYPRRTLRGLARQYWEYGAAKGTLLARGRPLQVRHFVPAAMVTGGSALFLVGTFLRPARWLFRGLGLAYVATGLFTARRAAARTGGAPLLVTFGAMATMHVAYGAGFVYGGWRERRRRR
jgi:GT2 family glycosyltransferase